MAALEVVAAVFQRENTVLVCRKRAGLSNQGQWEFPGGKRNLEETFEAALIREITEELGVSIVVGHSLGSYSHDSSSRTINLHCFVVRDWHGEFVPVDHDALQWCTVDELRLLRLSDADVPFIDRIGAYLRSIESKSC